SPSSVDLGAENTCVGLVLSVSPKRPNPPGWLFVTVSLFSHFFCHLPQSALVGLSRNASVEAAINRTRITRKEGYHDCSCQKILPANSRNPGEPRDDGRRYRRRRDAPDDAGHRPGRPGPFADSGAVGVTKPEQPDVAIVDPGQPGVCGAVPAGAEL